MSVKWTKEQQQVIGERDKNILVSAAAGSGKTAVLVERIAGRLMEEENPLHVDELLVVTFTEAAAGEMKDRIGAALQGALETAKNRTRIKRELTLLPFAQISTIHSFCLRVIKEHFADIELSPGFRVGESTEMELLKRDVAEEVVTQAFEERGEAFLQMVDALSPGKSDALLIDLLIRVYDFSGSDPDPEAFLLRAQKSYEGENTALMENCLRQELLEQIQYMQAVLQTAIELTKAPGGPEKYREALEDDMAFLKKLSIAETLDEAGERLAAFKHTAFKRLSKKDAVDEKIQTSVKDYRDECKKTLKTLKEGLFARTFTEQKAAMQEMAPVMREFCDLIRRFESAYSERKRRQSLLDFRDMEQFALKVLVKKTETGYALTEAAQGYREEFKEVMVDEYQDSNRVQELILWSVTRERALFMVGDVKQSIYGFRLACPELFMEKYHDYKGTHQDRTRIDLKKNFRSREKVLQSTNVIFEQIMQKDLGGITYDDAAALCAGADYPDAERYDTDVLLLDTSRLDALEEDKIPETGREKEARMTAAYIKDFLKDGEVYDKKAKVRRKATYGDIVILLRSMKGWSEDFVRILKAEGIPADAVTQEGYFSAWEVSILLDCLNLLDNFHQDIPLSAVLMSPIGGFTGEDLAKIRIARREESLSRAVLLEARTDARLGAFMDFYSALRRRVPYSAVSDLLLEILDATGFMDLISTMPGGAQRRANVQMLVSKARDFENTSYHGLFHFIRYIEQLKKYHVDFGEAAILEAGSDTVHIMSIHKSKGLEFPVVIVSGLGKQFNRQDQKSALVMHRDLGIGIDCVNLENRTKSVLLMKELIKHAIEKDMLAEELRVLYVAMTRAEEKLVLTGQIKDPEKNFMAKKMLFKYPEKVLPVEMLLKADSLLDYITMGLIRNRCFAGALAAAGLPAELLNPLFGAKWPFNVHLKKAEAFAGEENAINKKRYANRLGALDQTFAEKALWDEKFSYVYPHKTSGKRKYGVTELTHQGRETQKRTAPAGDGKGIERGNAYHRAFELFDFDGGTDMDAFLKRKVQAHLMTKEAALLVEKSALEVFGASKLAERMQAAAQKGLLYREQPFLLALPEKDGALVQGIIDAFFIEEGEIVVVDYKTDRVRTGEILVARYKDQISLYARALSGITGRPVREKILYSVALGQEIRV